MFETWYYEVVSIDGDYANLKRTDIELDDLKLVARALLPADADRPDGAADRKGRLREQWQESHSRIRHIPKDFRSPHRG